ncbi:MAG: hypothetical protein MZU95_09460 [Desulfomicrobium escambiense]|nr:hypothetical protein [Desulfomicrobium escambiense]
MTGVRSRLLSLGECGVLSAGWSLDVIGPAAIPLVSAGHRRVQSGWTAASTTGTTTPGGDRPTHLELIRGVRVVPGAVEFHLRRHPRARSQLTV